MKRVGSVIKIDEEGIKKYRDLHKNVWPEVLEMLKKCNIGNYSIFYKDNLLFSYFEYSGDNYSADIEKMAGDPKTQEWWNIVKPLLKPLPTRKNDEFWAEMEEIFYLN